MKTSLLLQPSILTAQRQETPSVHSLALSPFEESFKFNTNITKFKAFESMQKGEKMMGEKKGGKLNSKALLTLPS